MESGVLIPDLFSHTHEIKLPKQPSKRGCKYHDSRGKFTDKSTSEIALLKKQLKVSTTNEAYWKRQAERLSTECNQLKKMLNEKNIQ